MIRRTRGDILKADAEALVNTVNCDGFMGRGIALQFKRAWPDNFRAYEEACKRREVQPGSMFITATGRLVGPRWLVNFPTKRHWRGKSRMADIEAGLAALVQDVRRLGIRSIAVPPLGCGLGGLDWSEVRPRIEAAFAALPEVAVLLFEPGGAPPTEEMTRGAEPQPVTPQRAVMVGLVERYLSGLMEPWVTLLEIHKLMYFAQEAGEPLRLRYVQGHYGPYAQNLRHVLARVEGDLLTGYADGGEQPDKEIALVPGAVERARAVLQRADDSRARFERVVDLVEGYETPYGMELLATVHWAATRMGARSPAKAVEKVHGWNAHKRQFTERQIGLAWDALTAKGWLQDTPSSGGLRAP